MFLLCEVLLTIAKNTCQTPNHERLTSTIINSNSINHQASEVQYTKFGISECESR